VDPNPKKSISFGTSESGSEFKSGISFDSVKDSDPDTVVKYKFFLTKIAD
jgi:hypothetical protein